MSASNAENKTQLYKSSELRDVENKNNSDLVYTACYVSIGAVIIDLVVSLLNGNLQLFYIGLIPFTIIIIGYLITRFYGYQGGVIALVSGFNIYFPIQHHLYGMKLGMEPVYLVLIVFIVVTFEGKHKRMLALVSFTILSYLLSRYLAETGTQSLSYLVPAFFKDIYFFASCVACISLLIRMMNIKNAYLAKNSELLESLEQKNSILEEKNEELESFAFATSHDLKTPVRNIMSFTGLIKKEVGAVTPEVSNYFDIIKNASIKMSQSIDNILTISKLGHSEGPATSVTIDNIVDQVRLHFQDRIQLGEIIIEHEGNGVIQGDQKELEILLMNLVDNGVKYNSNNPAHITIVSKTIGDELSLNVSDNGIGISQEFYQMIFKPFKRLHGDREYQGTGLGLALVKKIVDKYAGSIELSSGKEGTTFHVKLSSIL